MTKKWELLEVGDLALARWKDVAGILSSTYFIVGSIDEDFYIPVESSVINCGPFPTKHLHVFYFSECKKVVEEICDVIKRTPAYKQFLSVAKHDRLSYGDILNCYVIHDGIVWTMLAQFEWSDDRYIHVIKGSKYFPTTERGVPIAEIKDLLSDMFPIEHVIKCEEPNYISEYQEARVV